jgi:hypothetical protein
MVNLEKQRNIPCPAVDIEGIVKKIRIGLGDKHSVYPLVADLTGIYNCLPADPLITHTTNNCLFTNFNDNYPINHT